MNQYRKWLGTGMMAAAVVFPVWAGESVQGSGPTKSAAADDANRRAQDQANAIGTCITPAKISDCVKDSDGGYICTAYVANHKGSC